MKNGNRTFVCHKKVSKKICNELRPCMQKTAARFRDPVSGKTSHPATLYYLADEGRMLKVSSVFDIGKSTMSKVIRRVTQTMSKYLGNKHIALPTNQK